MSDMRVGDIRVHTIEHVCQRRWQQKTFRERGDVSHFHESKHLDNRGRQHLCTAGG